MVAFEVTLSDGRLFLRLCAPCARRGPRSASSTAELAQTLFDPQHGRALGFFASFLFTHNAQIAILAFALGFACCLPAAFLMFYNGLMLGAFLAIFSTHGLLMPFGGWP